MFIPPLSEQIGAVALHLFQQFILRVLFIGKQRTDSSIKVGSIQSCLKYLYRVGDRFGFGYAVLGVSYSLLTLLGNFFERQVVQSVEQLANIPGNKFRLKGLIFHGNISLPFFRLLSALFLPLTIPPFFDLFALQAGYVKKFRFS